MGDLLLKCSVVLLPTIFALVVEMVSKERREHKYWRKGVFAFGLFLSALTAVQIWRDGQIAKSDRDAAISETSNRVATETSKRVTEETKRQYQSVIGELNNQVGELKKQLATEGKKVDAAANSNFVTGKTPVKVEVTNSNESQNRGQPLVSDGQVHSIKKRIASIGGGTIRLLVIGSDPMERVLSDRIIEIFVGWRIERT